MLFKEGSPLYASEVERKSGEDVLYVNYLPANFVPSIAENPDVMERTIEQISEYSSVSRIIFVQHKNYNYPYEQIYFLNEIATLYNYLVKHENILSLSTLSVFGDVQTIYKELSAIISLLKRDPIACYRELKRTISIIKSGMTLGMGQTGMSYLKFLEKILSLIEQTKFIQLALQKGESYSLSGRSIYSQIFRPDVLPNFTFTRLMAQLPQDSELIYQYELEHYYEKFLVTILKNKNDVKYIYHIVPPEYSLSEEHYYLVNLARGVLSEHRPKGESFSDPDRTRQIFFNVARDLLSELSKTKNISLSQREIEKLSHILVRHTIGFGILELLLADDNLQDIVLNAPISQNHIFVRHSKYDECVTNIIPSFEDAESWAGKLRLQSGRPLDEANPILDTEISFGNTRARVAAIKEPLSPQGLAYALRRHRDQPWTLPLFIEKKMLNSFAAGLLSFFIDGNRTLLVAGTRSSGKTSLLGSLLLEIMSKYRVLVVEDTLELPVDALRKIGYNIQRMKVRSALVSGSSEIEASEGIRTSLRLGDSALIVGEVRSSEAKALYEAMRVGALANVVAGTIHGDSPYGVFDRVVNDLGVQPTSFKATDLIIITNPIKSSDGLSSERRVVSITEVRKHWIKDPLQEQGFVDLMKYNVEKDELEPTPELINGDSYIIKQIASNVKGWAGNWDAVYDNIILRGKIKQLIVDKSHKLKKPDLLEAKFNSLCNSAFHEISSKVRKEGDFSSDKVFREFEKWFDERALEF